MPVRKFRSIEEMEGAKWRCPGDPALYRAMAITWDFSRRSNPRRFPPGAVRFATLEEMRRQQDEWDAQHVMALWKSRQESTTP